MASSSEANFPIDKNCTRLKLCMLWCCDGELYIQISDDYLLRDKQIGEDVKLRLFVPTHSSWFGLSGIANMATTSSLIWCD